MIEPMADSYLELFEEASTEMMFVCLMVFNATFNNISVIS
jgi:hypothetical protein